jgi:hypothetical protein
MTEALSRQSKGILALVGAISALCLALLVPPPTEAQAAGWTAFCNNQWQGAYGQCTGAARIFNAETAWGEQHSVCVFNIETPAMCSAGPSSTVYSPNGPYHEGYYKYLYPQLQNNAQGSNFIHAAAWTQ